MSRGVARAKGGREEGEDTDDGEHGNDDAEYDTNFAIVHIKKPAVDKYTLPKGNGQY